MHQRSSPGLFGLGQSLIDLPRSLENRSASRMDGSSARARWRSRLEVLNAVVAWETMTKPPRIGS